MTLTTLKRKKLSDKVIKLYLKGLTVKDIYDRINHEVSKGTIRNMLLTDEDARMMMEKRRNNQVTDMDDSEAYSLRMQGCTYKEIGDRFNVTAMTARNHILRYQEANSTYLRPAVETDSKRSRALKKVHEKRRKEGKE